MYIHARPRGKFRAAFFFFFVTGVCVCRGGITACRHTSKKRTQLLSWNKELCESSRKEYDRASYGDLMNTTFALLPAGRSPATYRLGEALSAGALPVFIHQVLSGMHAAACRRATNIGDIFSIEYFDSNEHRLLVNV